MKKLISKVLNKGKKAVFTSSLAVFAMIVSATSAFASTSSNPDLDAVTGNLTTGAGDMKTNFLTIIAVIIGIIIVVFGIGWLINLFKRNMNKA